MRIKTLRRNIEIRQSHITQFKDIQERIKNQIIYEKSIKTKQKFEKMINDKSRNTFWKEKKKMSRNPVLESLIIKDEQGMRQYDPEKIKEHTAKYYENLYKKKDTTPHPYHQEVQHKITT